MKKILSLLLVFGIGFVIFGIISNKAGASKPVFKTGAQDELDQAKHISLNILRDRATQRAIGNVDEFQVQTVEVDDLGMAHTRVRQTIGGIPVWEGEAIVHLTKEGELSTITDELKESIAVNTEPNFSEKDAYNIAVDMYRGRAKLGGGDNKIDLFIYRGETRDHLVYRVETPRIAGDAEPSAPVVFIDAQTGEKVFGYDNLQTGTGSSLYSGSVTIDTSSLSGTFYMEDLTRRLGTFNMNNTGNTTTGTGGTQSRYSGTDDSWTATVEQAGVDAHYGAAENIRLFPERSRAQRHQRHRTDPARQPPPRTAESALLLPAFISEAITTMLSGIRTK